MRAPEEATNGTTVVRPAFAEIFMSFAEDISRRSTCSRLKVGAVITTMDSRQVLGIGYNGGASGLENACESEEVGACGHLHAEENAIINCRADRTVSKYVYLTNLPCPLCCKRLINLGGVQRVIWRHDYRVRDGLELLRRAGVDAMSYEDFQRGTREFHESRAGRS